MTLDDLPDLLTVSELAKVLRISRGTAYAEVKRFETSGGRQGLPMVRIGRSVRTPKEQLRQWLLGRTPDGASST